MRPTPAPELTATDHFADVTAGGGAARPGQFHLRVLGGLRQRWLARPLRLLREAAQSALSQQARRFLRGGRQRRRSGRRRPFPLQGGGLDRLRQRRPPRPVPQQSEQARQAVPQRQQSRWHLCRGHVLPMGINGPSTGFSCWAWDYDNDGWLDIFATSYDATLKDVVKGLIGEPHTAGSQNNKLFRNLGGSPAKSFGGRDRKCRPASTWSSARWGATSPTSTTTASSTSTSRPATPT